ncbi:MAG: HK97-gp10 family putative phage morphogenesis protein [Nitrospira sp.]
MANTVRIRGAEELARAFQAHGVDVQRGLVGVTMAAAMVIREAAAAKAPRRYGTLSDEMMIGEPKIDGWKVTVGVGPSKNAFYGRFQEFGTGHHAAQPFLRPAVDENGDRAISAAGAEAEKLIK